ncbi:zinc ribbon domain-containing protein [Occultella kanbiaonis]|uniref:zinc ribbon domain-containing protein n=1 Tax=Occultella kanbiaonis TaxID=2675754 RepID=UPI00338F899F
MNGRLWTSATRASRSRVRFAPRPSALLSGLVRCGHCDARMHRGTTQGRHSYYCPRCHMAISNIEERVPPAEGPVRALVGCGRRRGGRRGDAAGDRASARRAQCRARGYRR